MVHPEKPIGTSEFILFKWLFVGLVAIFCTMAVLIARWLNTLSRDAVVALIPPESLSDSS